MLEEKEQPDPNAPVWELQSIRFDKLFTRVGRALMNQEAVKKKLAAYGDNGANGMSGEQFALDVIKNVRMLGNIIDVQWDNHVEPINKE